MKYLFISFLYWFVWFLKGRSKSVLPGKHIPWIQLSITLYPGMFLETILPLFCPWMIVLGVESVFILLARKPFLKWKKQTDMLVLEPMTEWLMQIFGRLNGIQQITHPLLLTGIFCVLNLFFFLHFDLDMPRSKISHQEILILQTIVRMMFWYFSITLWKRL